MAMMRASSLLITIAALFILTMTGVADLGSGTRTASATCSIGATDYAAAALRNADRGEILLVGTVTDERSLRQGVRTFYEAIVAPEAVLKGEMPAEPLVLSFLGHLGGDCSGGPRMQEGERVLIPIHKGRLSYGGGETGWQLTGIFSKVRLEDGRATLEWWMGSEPLGDADDVIRQYGLAVDAEEQLINNAIRAANAPPTAKDSGVLNPLWIGLATLMVVVALAAVWSRHRRLAQR